MTDYYSSPQAVITRTGVEPADLGLDEESDPDAALQGFLVDLLTELAEMINRKIKRNYLALFDAGKITAIPVGLVGIVADIAADSIRTMVATRQTPVVRIDDFAVTVLRSRVFSPDVLERLKLYGKRGLGSLMLTNR